MTGRQVEECLRRQDGFGDRGAVGGEHRSAQSMRNSFLRLEKPNLSREVLELWRVQFTLCAERTIVLRADAHPITNRMPVDSIPATLQSFHAHRS
jgi:hypothetical protein